jgi:hypothetical protein
MIYVVGFAQDGSSYFFHSKENAEKFVREAYEDDFGGTVEDETYLIDMTQLDQEGYIEDYAWIEEHYFEDE